MTEALAIQVLELKARAEKITAAQNLLQAGALLQKKRGSLNAEEWAEWLRRNGPIFGFGAERAEQMILMYVKWSGKAKEGGLGQAEAGKILEAVFSRTP
jgi:hypothetical protein